MREKIRPTYPILDNLSKHVIFNPVWLTQYKLRQCLAKTLGFEKIKIGESWLDVGCGARPYESLFPNGTYLGIDVIQSGREMSLKSPDVFYDGSNLPFGEMTFDGLLCSQVIEHVRNPEHFLKECCRVLKTGGKIVITAPFVWPEHEEPWDFLRFSSFGINHLIDSCGFDDVSFQKTSGAIETVAQLLSTYFSTNLLQGIPYCTRLVSLLLCCPVQLLGIIFQHLLPDRGNLFLDSVVVGCKRT